MSEKNKRQFGVWMDSHHATIVGKVNDEAEGFTILEHIVNETPESNTTSEKTAHNAEKTNQHKFFKKITSHMQNAMEVHLTGTGTAQEQFMHYLADTPQFKNTVTTESTSNKMSDDKLLEFFSGKFK